ncbi:MAG TPA: hypothetical protein VGF28_11085 [Thermoanaerobaculia bacterium]|jgi:hypothetical protein
MAGSGKAENTVNIIIEAGDFQFNDSLEAADGKTARDAGRAIANFALSQFAPPRRKSRQRDASQAPGETK